ncbi:hypothetical protein [Gynurincola endophyticus]|uniref:hypothetical protein n=1 Tax=Gynurincola endophyticus TaxID=2479004 RepID=UPI000F8D1F2E|nr:hypothetical protein [Gynurincola endophyticus]
MKLLFTLLLNVCIAYSYAQSADQCGKDNNPLLTQSESIFLNHYFAEKAHNFDFSGKKYSFSPVISVLPPEQSQLIFQTSDNGRRMIRKLPLSSLFLHRNKSRKAVGMTAC